MRIKKAGNALGTTVAVPRPNPHYKYRPQGGICQVIPGNAANPALPQRRHWWSRNGKYDQQSILLVTRNQQRIAERHHATACSQILRSVTAKSTLSDKHQIEAFTGAQLKEVGE